MSALETVQASGSVPVERPAAAVSIRHVKKMFKAGSRIITALDDLCIDVAPSCITGLIGPDGAGKTTLMRLILGLILPDEGEITVFGTDVIKDPGVVQKDAGYMPQRFGLYEDLTVLENMELYGDLKDLPADQRKKRYEDLFKMSGLAPFTSRLAGRLSGGMKQKLGLICTLLSSPRLLILDEPTVGVDPLSRRELWTIVNRMVEKEGMTVILSTAYLDEAERCQDVILLHEGRLIKQAEPKVFTDMMAGQSFMVTAPSLGKRALRQRLSGIKGVIDSTIQADGVRLVVKKGMDTAASVSDVCPQANVSPVPARFEDAFVFLVRQKEIPSSVGPLMRDAGLDVSAASDVANGVIDVEIQAVECQPEGASNLDDLHDVIVVKGLERWFGGFCAVKNVSFSVKKGEIFGLLGANGAGKSTTFRMLCGLLPPSDGHLEVAGEDLRRAPARARAKIGYMAQKFSLYVNLTVAQNLNFFAGVYGLNGARKKERISWALEEFELESYKDTTSSELPLGYKQRLALAASLMHEPHILFLDEPTSGVDPIARREFWTRINTLAESGVTVLVTTHFMEEAEYCDRLAIMARGEVLALGAPDELKAKYLPDIKHATMEEVFISILEGRRENVH
ncbi:ATP-binding cassette domain-containing protein [Dissulfurimicrobium hydrothermale]|uniref:ATP-binding cassette domain-containing protein n=1 Tax=Dissulfurimicrobium hydrothermale TaxID=1750598 RepID=UPI001EDB6232|nr:ATP-binding cassette domain-containing protein [Dissulfurimicrobium hydrothermale]UKL12911.1 ATP-binding cassette domain-containing protein [Dissulfurimicrobium hydrothermale]